MKKNKILAEQEIYILEQENKLIDQELHNKELQSKQLKEQLDFKTRELTTHTLNLIQKNEMLTEIRSALQKLKGIESDPDAREVRKILNNINLSFHQDKEWENFKMHFETVHQSFFERLSGQYPTLTASDLKLCALLRLNLDSKEISGLLGISPTSTKVARYRLRKKLNLESDQNLSAFLASY